MPVLNLFDLSKKALTYIYPIWQKGSFSKISKYHIKYLRKYYRIHEVDISMINSLSLWTSRKEVIIHPMFYPILGPPEKPNENPWEILGKLLIISNHLIGFDTADSDRISLNAVMVANNFDLICVPSNFARKAFVESGVKVRVEVVPHGLDDIYNRKERVPRNVTLYKLYKLKNSRKYVYVLFFLLHCYDEKTRILTKDGFKKWNEITKYDEIATFNLKTSELEYQRPEGIFIYRYKGKMIHFKGQHYDLLVTPNHRMIVRRSRNYIAPKNRDKVREWEIKEASELLINRNWVKYEIPRTVKWKGIYKEYFEIDKELNRFLSWSIRYKHERLPIKPFLRFLGWFISEGQARFNEHNGQAIITIYNNKNEYLKEIAETIKELGYNPIIDYNRKCVIVSSIQLYRIIKALGLPIHPIIKGRKAHLKFVPNFIKELSPELIKEFLIALWKGDGTFYKTKDGKLVPIKYSTVSKKLAEDVAELCLKCGYAVSISIDNHPKRVGKANHPLYNVIISRRYKNPSIRKKPKLIDYDGIVWCVKVPNGAIIVERNGKIMISGNSGYRKGADLVYQCMKEIQATHKNVILVVKRGNLEDPYMKELRKLRMVEVAGWLSEDDLVDLYDLCDIVVVPSRGGGFEMNALEAAARGKIVLVPQAGCFLDYIDYCIGIKIAKRPVVLSGNNVHVGRGHEVDVNDFVNKLHDVLNNLSYYKEVFRARRSEVFKKFSWKAVCQKIVKIFNSLGI